MKQESVIQQIHDAIQFRDHFLLTTHVHPDGDSVSSVLVIAYILTQLNKKFAIAVDDDVPEKYHFLPGIHSIINCGQFKPDFPVETCIVVDASNEERIGTCADFLKQCSFCINIDHHAGNTKYGSLNWVDGCESSTVEMTYRLLQTFPFPLTPEIASLIYVGIICDTGRFRFQNTTHRCVRTASEMLEAKISAYEIADRMYFRKHPDTLRALGATLTHIELFDENRIGTMYLDLKTLRQYPKADSEGFVEYLQSIGDTQVNLFCREMEPGVFRVSLRSKIDLDVSLVAEQFGGGGHARAAGCTINGSIDHVKKQLVEVIKSKMQ